MGVLLSRLPTCLNYYVAIDGVATRTKSILRNIRPGTTENLFGGQNWEAGFFGDEDGINLTITAGDSLSAPLFEFALVRSGAYDYLDAISCN